MHRLPSKIVFSLLLFILSLHSKNLFAFSPEKLFVASSTAEIIDPVTKKQIRSVEKGFVIEKPFLLNSVGGRYASGKNQEPYYFSSKEAKKIDQKIYIGFEIPDSTKTSGKKIAAIEINKLTATEDKEKFSTPTPIVEEGWAMREKAIITACENFVKKTPVEKLTHELQAIKAKIHSDENKLIAIIRNFHNSTCESTRSKDEPDTMSEAIKKLKQEWDQFIQAQNGNEAKALAAKARELDLVARTVAFETHPLGELDEKEEDQCTKKSDCPISSCERDIIALSIRNRGMVCHKQGCKFKGDFEGVATNPSGYSIWLPKWSHEFISSCFLRDGISSGKYIAKPGMTKKGEEAYRKRALAFQLALASTAKVLYAKNLNEIFSYQESGEGRPAGIENFLNYYHPMGMVGCSPSTYDKIHSVSATYIRKKVQNGYDYDLLWKKRILLGGVASITKESKKKKEFYFLVQDWNSFKRKKELLAEGKLDNVSYQFKPYSPGLKHSTGEKGVASKNEWMISEEDMEKWSSSHKCLPMGLAVMQEVKNACRATQKPHYFTVPAWAMDSNAKRAAIGCKNEMDRKALIQFGGDCDMRIQPISGVK